MPRVRESPNEKMNTALQAGIARGMAMNKIEHKADLASRIGCGQSAMYNKLRRPEIFKLQEFRRLVKVLELTDAEILDAVKEEGVMVRNAKKDKPGG